MGRTPCCEKNGLKKGPWTPEEDQKLVDYIQRHGHGSWRALPKRAGLLRCGKSCRLRWTNYLRPDIKRGQFSFEEEHTIIELHAILGNKWSAIAGHLPGRTDNEIKNFWNTHLKKRLLQMGIDPVTHRPRVDLFGFSNMSPFLAPGLNHMTQWGNARLEAEARLATEYLRQAAMMQAENGTTASTRTADLLMGPWRSQFGDNFCKNYVIDPAWSQQAPAMASHDYKGPLPQTLEQLLHAQTNGYSSNINGGSLLSNDNYESVTKFLDSMCSLALGTSPSESQILQHHGQHASPSSSLMSSINGPQMKMKQGSLGQSEGPNLHKQTMFENRRRNFSGDGTELNAVCTSNNIKALYDNNVTDQSYNDVLPCAMQGPVLHRQHNISCIDRDNQHSASTLWPEDQLLAVAKEQDSVPALMSSTSTSNMFSESHDLNTFVNSSSSVANTISQGGDVPVSGPEILNPEESKEYWSTMLKSVGAIPAFHVISTHQ
eukprot:Gb_15606 [translate_table: standard]